MKRALALIEAPGHVCYRYRIQAFEAALRASGWEGEAQPLPRNPARRATLLWRARDYDAVILQRKLLPSWQLALLRRRARRLIYDFDDAVLYRDSYDARGLHCPRRATRFGRTVRAADLVLAGNAFLAECAEHHGGRPERVAVLPTCVDVARYHDESVRHKQPPGSMEMVWIGSSSTLQGLEQKTPLWVRVGREQPGVALRIVSDRFPRFEPLRVIPARWRPTSEFEDLVASDLGMSWIPDDLWSRGKCGLKILQYQAAGLPVLTTPVGVHPEMVRPGENGELPRSDDEWLEAIRRFADDPTARNQMGQAARDAVGRDYSIAAWSAAFVAAVSGVGSIEKRPLDPHIRGPHTTASARSVNGGGDRPWSGS